MKKIIILSLLIFLFLSLIFVVFIYLYDPPYNLPEKYNVKIKNIDKKDNLYYDLVQITQDFNFPPDKNNVEIISDILTLKTYDENFVQNLLNNYKIILDDFDKVIDKKEIQFPDFFEIENDELPLFKIINISKLYLISCIYEYQKGNKDKCFKKILKLLQFADKIETSNGKYMEFMISRGVKGIIINTFLRLIDNDTFKYINECKKYFLDTDNNLKKSLAFELKLQIDLFNKYKDSHKIKYIFFKHNKTIKSLIEIYEYLINNSNILINENINLLKESITYKKSLPLENIIGYNLLSSYMTIYIKSTNRMKIKNFNDTTLLNVIEAIKSFEIHNKRFPNNLNELIPTYLDTIPIEKKSNNEIKYSKKERSIYFLERNKFILK